MSKGAAQPGAAHDRSSVAVVRRGRFSILVSADARVAGAACELCDVSISI
jgi:hypothetical protein